MKLLISTTNLGKRFEFISLFQGLLIELVFPDDVGIHIKVDETGSTYAENAALKAEAFCAASGLLTLADDSGLEVDALGGRPGLHSARFSPIAGASDADRRKKLLQELHDKPTPWNACFFCSVALARPNQVMELFDGMVAGVITPDERGDNGFGYDSLFWIPPLGKTMAELDMEEKNRYSHRALAVKKAMERINKWMNTGVG